jgi:hypothetical protein
MSTESKVFMVLCSGRIKKIRTDKSHMLDIIEGISGILTSQMFSHSYDVSYGITGKPLLGLVILKASKRELISFLSARVRTFPRIPHDAVRKL